MANILLTVLLCVALVYADYNEELVKRNAFGITRFGKRSMRTLESGEDSSGLPRLARSGASLGTMRFGKRSMAGGEYATEEMEMSPDSKRSTALGTMRFGRR